MKRIGLLGCGKLGGVIADALLSGAVPGCELAVIHARSPESARRLSQRYPCPIAASMDALAQQQPDYVMEAASPQAVWAFAPRYLGDAGSLRAFCGAGRAVRQLPGGQGIQIAACGSPAGGLKEREE